MNIVNDLLSIKNQMYRLALRITLNSQEAEDVVQDVIIKIWKMTQGESAQVMNLSQKENLEPFAMRLTRNLAIDRQRMKVNQTDSLDVLIDGGYADRPNSPIGNESVTASIESSERIDTVRRIMATLPEKQRTAMQLRDFEGKSYKEIADIMDVTEDQVKVSIFRARQAVKAKIKK